MTPQLLGPQLCLVWVLKAFFVSLRTQTICDALEVEKILVKFLLVHPSLSPDVSMWGDQLQDQLAVSHNIASHCSVQTNTCTPLGFITSVAQGSHFVVRFYTCTCTRLLFWVKSVSAAFLLPRFPRGNLLMEIVG